MNERIQVIPDINGARFILPPRRIENAQAIGLPAMFVGGVMTVFMVFWMYHPLKTGLSFRGAGSWFFLVFGLTGLPGLAAGLGILGAGAGVMTGRTSSEIRLARDRIQVVEHLGFIRWTRRLRIRASQIRRMRISKGAVKNANGTSPLRMESLMALTAEGDFPRPVPIAIAYPSDVLQSLADVFSKTLVQQPRLSFDATPAAIRVDLETTPELPGNEPPREKPAYSRAVYAPHPDGFGISFPPAGLKRGTKGLLFFSVAWNAFILFFTVMMAIGTSKIGHDRGPGIGGFLFLIPFYAIGIGTMMATLNMGRRRTLIAVTGDRISIRTIGLRKTREWTFRREDLAAVRMGPNGMRINDRDVMELQILPRTGEKIGLLSQYTEAELEWVASQLRRQFHLPSQAG